MQDNDLVVCVHHLGTTLLPHKQYRIKKVYRSRDGEVSGVDLYDTEPEVDARFTYNSSRFELVSTSQNPKGVAKIVPDTYKDAKPTNPKDAVGIAKVPMSTVPAPVLMEVALAMMEGSLKYGRHNYREMGGRGSVYYDACMRHLMEWYEGVTVDKYSGINNLSKAIACLVIIRDCEMRGNLVDDRPPPAPEGFLEELNKKAKELLEEYPNPKPAFTAK